MPMPSHTTTDNPDDCRPLIGECGIEADDSADDQNTSPVDAAHRIEQIVDVLEAHHISRPEIAKVKLFVAELDSRMRVSKIWRRRLNDLMRSGGWGNMDILGHIDAEKRAGDHDEALWRAFLAAHFGRHSADSHAMDSAGRFLCGFDTKPMWTWKNVSKHSDEFFTWVNENECKLKTLSYGNHRKFESKQPGGIKAVMSSFVAWVHSRGDGPADAFVTDVTLDAAQRFRALYKAFTVYRFKRTGRFDLLCLIRDMTLLPIEPDSCYIPGSTGPRHGIELLCGRRGKVELGEIADELARTLSVSYDIMEDTLCMWQKPRQEHVRTP